MTEKNKVKAKPTVKKTANTPTKPSKTGTGASGRASKIKPATSAAPKTSKPSPGLGKQTPTSTRKSMLDEQRRVLDRANDYFDACTLLIAAGRILVKHNSPLAQVIFAQADVVINNSGMGMPKDFTPTFITPSMESDIKNLTAKLKKMNEAASKPAKVKPAKKAIKK